MTTGYFLTSHPTAVTHSRLTTKALLSPTCAASAPAAGAPGLTHGWPPAQLPAQLGTQGQRGQAMVAETFSRMAQLRCPLSRSTHCPACGAACQGQPGCWASPSPRPRCLLLSNKCSQSRNFHFPAPLDELPHCWSRAAGSCHAAANCSIIFS